MLRVLIVDDHPIVRQGLKQLLENTSDITVTGEVNSDNEALKEIRQGPCDLIILGVSLSGINSIELLKQIRSYKPKLPVLIFSVSGEEHYCERFLRAGASGYLTKQSATSDLIDAIKAVCSGRKYISPSLVEQLTDFTTDGPQSSSRVLSDREMEVMVAIVSGKKIKQIAEELSLSIKTVSTYHSRILQKLNFDSDAQLIRYAIEQGIVPNETVVKQNPIIAQLNTKTTSAIATIKEIWSQRKDVILILIVTSIISYIFLTFLVSVLI